MPGAFLRGKAILAILVGHTLRFRSYLTGRMMRLHFRADGMLEVLREDRPGHVSVLKWWIRNGRALCRTYGRMRRRVCNKIASGPADAVLRFHKGDGTYLFDATVHAGRDLSD